MQLKLDKVQLASGLDTYTNYETLTNDVLITGTVPATSSLLFVTNFPYDRSNTRADIYARNETTGFKRPLNGGFRQSPYVPKANETCTQAVYYSDDKVYVSFEISDNAGASITLNDQTLEVNVVLYQVPY